MREHLDFTWKSNLLSGMINILIIASINLNMNAKKTDQISNSGRFLCMRIRTSNAL